MRTPHTFLLIFVLLIVILGYIVVIEAETDQIVPVIDISEFFNGTMETKLEIAKKIGQACEDIGFFVIKGHNVPQAIIDDAWGSTQDFFDLDIDQKLLYNFDQHIYPFGYTKLGGEILSTGKSIEKTENGSAAVIVETALPDLKEMFSVGPSNPLAGYPERIYPTNPTTFAQAWNDYYDALSNLADSLLQAFAMALHLPDNFFQQFTDHHASALRALNYPELQGCLHPRNQYRASAHTDYGILTILKIDGPGLQVSKDKNPPTWHDVPVVDDAFIVNLGDLMKRWTNDKWLSTLHQVIISPGEMTHTTDGKDGYCSSTTLRRQSMAFFYNVNKDALISNLNKDQSKYEPIVAGDFLMAKHLAATGSISSTPKNDS